MKRKIVIIGSGLGGLSCGVLLAKEGYDVTILEQSSQAGGCLQCFKRKGIKFETGMHFIGSADKGQTLFRLMKALEIDDKIQLSRLNEDGYDVIFNYIVNPENVELIKNKLKNHTIKFVVLVVDEKTLLLRDKERPEDCQMKERCIVLLNSFKNKNYNAQNILDTTNLSVNETIDIIENDNRFIL